MPRGNGEVVGSDNWHMSTAVADDSSAEPRVQIQGYNQVSKPLPGPRVHCRSLFQGLGWGTTGIAPQRAVSTLRQWRVSRHNQTLSARHYAGLVYVVVIRRERREDRSQGHFALC
jgi:hypothetical protein